MPGMARIRLDQLLTDRGLARSRAEAQALIHAGDVILAGAPDRNLKPGQQVPIDAAVSLVAKPRWASRAGAKLEAALDAFAIDPQGIYYLSGSFNRMGSELSHLYARLARGEIGSAELPAYRFEEPVLDGRGVRKFLPHMADWDWKDGVPSVP